MITPKIVTTLYDAASMQRWNDYPRLIEINELDKQSHKFIIAFFLASYEKNINMLQLIEAGLFEFLRRVIVTDIRPDVFREVIEEKQKEINSWVLESIKEALADVNNGEFFDKMQRYFSDQSFYRNERELLSAAHYLATRWEFQIVYQSGKFLNDIEELKKAVESDIEKFMHYKGVVEIGLGAKLSNIIDMCGRLRFQIRWAQTPRIPKTSVLGHELIVAIYSYFFSLKISADHKRIVNNFFCALFHDLPEAFTRDIISPVKRSVAGLDELIIEYEIRLIREKILPFVPDNLREYFSYLLGLYKDGDSYKKDEFRDRNDVNFGVIDGKALKACDHLAAFTEAVLSISYGIKSKELENGVNLKNIYKTKEINGVNFGAYMEEIERYLISAPSQ